MKKHFIILLIFSLLIMGAEVFARGQVGRGFAGQNAGPSGFKGEGFLVELPAETGSFIMSGIGTLVIYPVLFYAQGLGSGFSSDKSWGTAHSFALSTFGYLGYYTFGTPCWLIKKTLWDAPMFCLRIFF